MRNTVQIRCMLYLVLTLISSWRAESAEVTTSKHGLRLFAAEEATNYVVQNVTPAKSGVTITIIDSNMSSSLKQSALSSLAHNSEIYSDAAKILWYTNEEMNDKHPHYLWLGAVDFSYIIATGAYLKVHINNNLVFMFGVKNC